MKQNFVKYVEETLDAMRVEDPIQGHDVVIVGLPGNPSHFELDVMKGGYTGVMRAGIPLTPSLAKDPTPVIQGIEIWTTESEGSGIRLGTQVYNLFATGSYEARLVGEAGRGCLYMLYEIPVSIIPVEE